MAWGLPGVTRKNAGQTGGLGSMGDGSPPSSSKGKKVKERIDINGFPSHSYGTSLAIWDHTVLPTTRHK